MEYKKIIDAINRRAYTGKPMLHWYGDLDVMQDAERAILEQIGPLIKNKRLLDIGVGGGRTTKLLLPISRNYVGIDYAPDLVETAKGKYPEANILCRDARDLTSFDNATFDFVLASNNGLDYMVHEDRIAVMKEVFRVLKASGLFMFSTHNRDYEDFDRLPWQQRLSFDLDFLKNCAHALYYLPKHLSLNEHAMQSDKYAVINDNAHGYSLLTYYLSIDQQIEQLTQAGFVGTEAYGFAGTVCQSDTSSPWIYYLTRTRVS